MKENIKEKFVNILADIVILISLAILVLTSCSIDIIVYDFDIVAPFAILDLLLVLVLVVAAVFYKDAEFNKVEKQINLQIDRLNDLIQLNYNKQRLILDYEVFGTPANLYNGKLITTIIYKQGGGVKLYYGNYAQEVYDQINKDYDDGLLTPTQKEEVKPKK